MSASSRVAAHARFEIRLTLRNGEQLLLTVLIPLVLLVALSSTSLVSLGAGRAIDIATPGILALAVMSSAFTGQAIATGFERRYGALRSLAVTPLGRSGLLLGKTAAVLVVEVLQVMLLGAVALVLGWSPQGSWISAVLLLLLATCAFSALGLLLAGTVRAEGVLAIANAVYLLLLLGGGVAIPLDRLPDPVAAVSRLLPSGALGEGLRDVLLDGGATPWGACAVLVAWAVGAGLLALRTFRWD